MKFRTRTRRLRAVGSPFIDHPDCAPEPTWPDKEYRLTSELSAEASANASAERPGLSVVHSTDDVFESPGHPTSNEERFRLLPGDEEGVARNIAFCLEMGDIAMARHQLGRLLELLSRNTDSGPGLSIAEVVERIDILREDNEYLRRENLRLHSELNQAIAQRDIARRARDEARARNAGMAP